MRTTFNLMRVCLALNAVRYRYHNSPAKQIEEAVKTETAQRPVCRKGA